MPDDEGAKTWQQQDDVMAVVEDMALRRKEWKMRTRPISEIGKMSSMTASSHNKVTILL